MGKKFGYAADKVCFYFFIITVFFDKAVYQSTDPNEDKSLAGKFLNESALISALDPYDPYKSAFETAYGIAKAIAKSIVISELGAVEEIAVDCKKLDSPTVRGQK